MYWFPMPRELELFQWRGVNVIFPPFWFKKEGLSWTQISIISAISILVIIGAGTGFSAFTVFVVYANNGNSNSNSSTTTTVKTTPTTTITFTVCIADGLVGATKGTASTNDADCAKDCAADSSCAVYLYLNPPGCVLFDSSIVLITPVSTFYPYTVKSVNGNPLVQCPP